MVSRDLWISYFSFAGTNLVVQQVFSLYRKQMLDNEKFLYLAISQMISMLMFSSVWILLGYAVIWSQAA